ncbi:MAG: exodeoxyribonuclease VII large subunit [Pseudanabaena sp. ELA607]|jgi:exodeoxyribonuclease VII large subunit
MSKNIWQVGELTKHIAQLLDRHVGTVQIMGEISGWSVASSGHRYFTLKDAQAQMDCVLWASRRLNFRPTNGMQVLVRGRLTVYGPRGKYQIDCDSLTPAGKGDLFLAFEALRQDLQNQGFFDSARKRDLPPLPQRIGVVTSASGAALQDILSTLARRAPYQEVFIAPARVQGEEASLEIAVAIEALNDPDLGLDVLIVGRGGGSMEDLWAFNTLPVVMAIFESQVPVISAVGHETDFTLADFVADQRAATPTGAAELVSQWDRLRLQELLDSYGVKFTDKITERLVNYHDRLDRLAHSYALQRVPDLLRQTMQQVDEFSERLHSKVQNLFQHKQQELQNLTVQLKALAPLAPLDRGFALLEQDGHILSPQDQINLDQSLTVIRKTESLEGDRQQRLAVQVMEITLD